MGVAPIKPGQVIKAKYRVDRTIGKGGMGWVVAGEHLGLSQRVAIKVLHKEMLDHPEIVARFAREARAASAIQSDYVARVMDVDTLDDGAPFMVMELLDGEDLGCVRRDREPLPLHVAVGYVLEACEAIAEAHALGIIHRDIKPANLFLARRPNGKVRVKVLDFGISKMQAGGEASVTSTEMVIGSAHYMSPEQMRASRDVDARTDIWSLGVTLFELTTAALPFPGASITQVCALVMSEPPDPPSRLRPGLPPAFDDIVLRCLTRDPDARFATVAQLVEALTPFAAPGAFVPGTSSTVHGGPRPMAPSSSGVGNTASALSASKQPQPSGPSAPLVIGLAAVLGILCVGGGYIALRSGSAAAVSSAVPTSPIVDQGAQTISAARPAPIEPPPETSAVPAVVLSASASPSVATPAASARAPTPGASPTPPRPKGGPLPRAANPVADCDPPFILNPDGTKRAKPECL